MCNNTQKKKAAGAGKYFTLFFGVMLHFNFKCVYRAESISSGERQPQHKPKQPLSGVIQESTGQIANLDSGEANVSRADGFSL